MEALRTPDDRFADLPDFPYAPTYVDDLPDLDGLRMAYIDEGPEDGPVFPVPPRRADLVVPVPQDDPRLHRGGGGG